jgi:hypothetical protein
MTRAMLTPFGFHVPRSTNSSRTPCIRCRTSVDPNASELVQYPENLGYRIGAPLSILKTEKVVIDAKVVMRVFAASKEAEDLLSRQDECSKVGSLPKEERKLCPSNDQSRLNNDTRSKRDSRCMNGDFVSRDVLQKIKRTTVPTTTDKYVCNPTNTSW